MTQTTSGCSFHFPCFCLTFILTRPPSSPQEVAVGERSRGGRLLEEPKIMLFKGNNFSLQVSIQDIPQLVWNIKPFTTCQVGGLRSVFTVSPPAPSFESSLSSRPNSFIFCSPSTASLLHQFLFFFWSHQSKKRAAARTQQEISETSYLTLTCTITT